MNPLKIPVDLTTRSSGHDALSMAALTRYKRCAYIGGTAPNDPSVHEELSDEIALSLPVKADLTNFLRLSAHFLTSIAAAIDVTTNTTVVIKVVCCHQEDGCGSGSPYTKVDAY